MRGGSAQPFRAQAPGVAAAATAGGSAATARGQPRRLAGSPDRSPRARAESRLDHRRPVAPRSAGSDDQARSSAAIPPPRSARRVDRSPPPPPPPRSANVRVTTAQHSSLIGGRYQIVKRIGQGGMGKVYEVNHIHLSRRFALKIISSQVAETDEARELFYREARFASAMAHPAITSVVDFGEDEKVGMFMVMEFVDGEPLNRILFREKRMTVKKACEIVLAVAEALHYIHRQNVVHCDIKTENILIGEEEIEAKRTRMVVKLLDFGLARSLVASRALDLAVGHAALRRARADPRRARVAGERCLRRRHLVVRAAHRPGPVGRPGPEDPRRSPRRDSASAVEADRRRPRSRGREARVARAREASGRASQGHGGVHLRAAHRDGHARLRPPPWSECRVRRAAS